MCGRKWAEEITKPQWSEEDKDAVDIMRTHSISYEAAKHLVFCVSVVYIMFV